MGEYSLCLRLQQNFAKKYIYHVEKLRMMFVLNCLVLQSFCSVFLDQINDI
jgi:hypothetical protein